MRKLFAQGLICLALMLACSVSAGAQNGRGGGEFKLQPQRPGYTDVYVLSFGLWGPQSVFESEARGAARILEANWGAKGRVIVRSNTKSRADAAPSTLLAASEAVGEVIDPQEDIVVLVLTSHGGPDGVGVIARQNKWLLTPRHVEALLDQTKARYRVVIVSACYSGIFARALADERTLVITAAAADKPSFGCRDGAAWTYFGDAFFNKALRKEKRLDVAFEKARALVTAREEREGFEPSNPQIAGGEAVLTLLGAR
ncbi:C13 family peptidase [Microvirga terricola]|uniref:Peptidase C13, legumain asparaginyl peptidase n=1 Tax=Microvirga terricola TaxID=2719797 RepID=A0ABX0V8W4_9HYPH|nr:C13 family peptidase [Microvirga terricola]NIX76299.1 peptidase C13, legumain asparaginyl peptidase [Microvirga terricola]